jgi:hypothetical protein
MTTSAKEIKEDAAPVTTTANAGAGLDSPQLPIKPNSVLTRFKQMKSRRVLSNNK